ncbi:MAG: sodium:calcium antiporter [Candidatus Eisenbacteria bacterium]|nr:sodium:calcium antiporter [Candidatus Eisenbacteria bacterium]
MVFSVVLFLAGIAILWGSSDLVTRSLGPIARRLKVSELVVTILGVSVFSSLPELSVSLFSALQGNSDVSIGNVVGSNFVTLTFVTALCALITPLRIRQEIRDRESSWMILSTAVVLMLAMDGVLTRLDGGVLIVLYIPYVTSVITEARRQAGPESHGVRDPGGRVWLHVVKGLAAVGGIVLGAHLALEHGQRLGLQAGIPPLAMGAIVFAFGTSLPELAIAVAATAKKKPEVSLGEIYSSNIFTALAVLGVCAVATPLQLTTPSVLSFDLPMLILAGVVIQLFITTGALLTRLEALLVLMLYGWFVAGHLMPHLVTGGIPGN